MQFTYKYMKYYSPQPIFPIFIVENLFVFVFFCITYRKKLVDKAFQNVKYIFIFCTFVCLNKYI